MGYLIDGILVSIIVLFIFLSAKKGFVATLIEIVGFIAVFMISFTAGDLVAATVYDKTIEPALVKNVSQNVDEAGQKAWNTLPKFVSKNSGKFGVSQEKFNELVVENTKNGTENAVKSASQQVLKPMCVNIIGTLVSIILIILLMLVVKFLAKFINGLFSFSIVGKLNRFLGGVLGVAKGVIMASVFCIIVSFIANIVTDGFLIFTTENIEKTMLFKTLSEFF